MTDELTDVSISWAQTNRADFLIRLEELRCSEGLQAAVSVWKMYVRAGLLPSLAALSGQALSRRANDFDLGVVLSQWLWKRAPNDAFVAAIALDASLAAGRIEEFTSDAERICRIDNEILTEDGLLKVASVAALGGLWDHVAQLVDKPPRNVSPGGQWRREVLRERVRISRNYRPGAMQIPVIVINLDDDLRKLQVASTLYSKMDMPLRRLAAVRGRDLTDFTVRNVIKGPGASLGRGAIGCAISHIAAWEQIANGQDEAAMVIEDDGLPYSWQNFDRILESAGEFDVLFVNERMSSIPSGELRSGCRDIWDTLGDRPNTLRGWGGDGYILTRAGAAKLLAAVCQDKIIGHIDGQLGSYGVEESQAATSRAQKVAVSCRQNMQSRAVLKAVCLNFPLVASHNFGYSSIVAGGGHQ